MGFGLPSALGAAAALDEPHRDTKPVVDIDGDGSFLMNIQVQGVTKSSPGAACRLGSCASEQFTCPSL
jgi:TPP-dependent 2-oxoacid decarboxylase